MPKSLNALAQWWEHAARDPSMQAIVILFAEPDYFQEVCEAKVVKKAAKQKKASTSHDGAMWEIENELLQVAEVRWPRKHCQIDALVMYTSDPVEPEGDCQQKTPVRVVFIRCLILIMEMTCFVCAHDWCWFAVFLTNNNSTSTPLLQLLQSHLMLLSLWPQTHQGFLPSSWEDKAS